MKEHRRLCARCGLRRSDRFFVSARGRVCITCQKKTRRKASHGARIEETYGITAAEYARLLAYQGGACAICGGSRGYNLHVDHDHKKEKTHGVRESVRGLLCARCNRWLLPGCVDTPAILLAAARYLERPPAQRVLARRVVRRRA